MLGFHLFSFHFETTGIRWYTSNTLNYRILKWSPVSEMGKVYYCVRKIAWHLTLPAAKAKLQLFHAVFMWLLFLSPPPPAHWEKKRVVMARVGWPFSILSMLSASPVVLVLIVQLGFPVSEVKCNSNIVQRGDSTTFHCCVLTTPWKDLIHPTQPGSQFERGDGPGYPPRYGVSFEGGAGI